MTSVPPETSAANPAERVLTSSDLLPIIWECVDDADSRTSLWRTQKAILQTIGTFTTPTFRVTHRSPPPISIPRPPAGVAFQRLTKLDVGGASPDQLVNAATGAPWLGSCGATLGSLELNGSSGPVLREWLQQLSPGVGQVPQLRHLQLDLGGELQGLAAHPLPPTLTSLNLLNHTRAPGVQPADLAILAPLDNLASLDLHGCRSAPLNSLPITALRSLTYFACRPGPDLSRLSALSRLLELDMADRGGNTHSVATLPPLRSVTRLSLGYVTGLGSLAGWASLRDIRFKECDELVDAGCLSGLQHLTRVELSDCYYMADISALAGLTTLETVELVPADDIPPLFGLPRLQSARLHTCNWKSGTDLTALTALTSLDLTMSGEFYDDFSPLACLTRLEELTLEGCDVDAESLGALTRLTSLHLCACTFPSGQDMHTLSVAALTQLNKLDVHGCDHLQAVEGLAGQQWLTEVKLWSVDRIKALDLRGCARLQLLAAYHCPHLTLVDLRGPHPLPVVDFRSGCSNVAVSLSDESSGVDILLRDCGGRRVWLEAARQAALDAETH